MDPFLFGLFCATLAGFALPNLKADIIAQRFSNNSYSCFVRHTKDGLEYHLTYNVCILEPSGNDATSAAGVGQVELRCLYYECTITAAELMAADGQLDCFRHVYTTPLPHPPTNDRITYRQSTAVPSPTRSRTKRDFSWVSFLEKISFMGRHQSTVSKQNEAYFHYNFMNKPSGGSGGSADGSRPVVQTAPPISTTTPAPVDPLASVSGYSSVLFINASAFWLVNMEVIGFGRFWASVLLLAMLMGAICTGAPFQCDDPEGNAEETFGKLQSIPPSTTEFVALEDAPVEYVPTKTQQDVLKSRNSKFLGVDRSSEEE
uniref:Uncharacterized protein n=1 Tax=Anopheles epiroticus TaxID=199890 RepID=A0A182PGC6_9DIPT